MDTHAARLLHSALHVLPDAAHMSPFVDPAALAALLTAADDRAPTDGPIPGQAA